MTAFTQTYPIDAEAIITKCAICSAIELQPNMVAPKVFHADNVLWDTGATCCLISQKVIEDLALNPIDKAIVSEATTLAETDVYLVHVGLPNGQIAINVEALASQNTDYDFIIGMDIIRECDFALTHPNMETKFTFDRPAKRDIDFTKE